MLVYQCVAHGRKGAVPAVACPECAADQWEDVGGKRRLRHPFRFRRVDAPLPMPAPAPAVDLVPVLEASLTGGEPPHELVHIYKPQPQMPAGPRSAGIDPGSHWIAVEVVEGAELPARHIASKVVEIGRRVPLRTPKVVKRADGSERTITHRRVIEDADLEVAHREIADFLRMHGVKRATVERATHFHGQGFAAVAGLLRSQWVGGELAAALRFSAGMPVESCSSRVWRTHARKRSGQKPWREALRALVTGLPEQPGEHVLDATGAAAWGLRSRVAPPRERAGKRTSAASNAARKERAAQLRAAIGCTCKGRKYHAFTCALAGTRVSLTTTT